MSPEKSNMSYISFESFFFVFHFLILCQLILSNWNPFFTIELWKCNHSAWVFHSYFNSSGLTSFQSRHHHEQVSKNDYQHHCSLFEFLFLNRKTISSELCAIIYALTVRKQFYMLHRMQPSTWNVPEYSSATPCIYSMLMSAFILLGNIFI